MDGDTKQYKIPIILTKYGYIQVSGTSMANALEKAKIRLENMHPTELEAIAVYQNQTAEIDSDGII